MPRCFCARILNELWRGEKSQEDAMFGAAPDDACSLTQCDGVNKASTTQCNCHGAENGDPLLVVPAIDKQSSIIEPTESSIIDAKFREFEVLLNDTILVDLRWLVQLALERGVLPPCQQLPPEARALPERMRRSTHAKCIALGMPILALSYPWWAAHHPDPDGQQLRQLLPILQLLQKDLDKYEGEMCTYGVLWDFAAFPQRCYTAEPGKYTPYTSGDPRFREITPGRFDDRTPEELDRFGRGVKSLNKFYMDWHITTLCVDTPIPSFAVNTRPYFERGWCKFEYTISNLYKNTFNLLLTSRFDAEEMRFGWDDFQQSVVECMASGKGAVQKRPPMDPEQFENMMRKGLADEEIAFTAGADLDRIVLPNYSAGFLSAMAALDKRACLVYPSLGWTSIDIEILAGTLRYAARHGLLENVSSLALWDNNVGEGVLALSNAFAESALPSLRDLSLDESQISNDGVVALAGALRSGAVPNLQLLKLCKNQISDDGVIAVANALQSGALPNLQEFAFDSNQIGNHGVAAFAGAVQSGAVPNLQRMHFAHNQIGNDGLVALAGALQSGALPNLQRMHFAHNQIGNDGFVALAGALQSGALPNLQEFAFDSNQIGNDGAAAFAGAVQSGALPNLQRMDFAHNQISNDGVVAVAGALQSGALPNLQQCDFRSNHIGDDGVAALFAALESGALPNLQKLDLGGKQDCRDCLGALVLAAHQRSIAVLKEFGLRWADSVGYRRSGDDVADDVADDVELSSIHCVLGGRDFPKLSIRLEECEPVDWLEWMDWMDQDAIVWIERLCDKNGHVLLFQARQRIEEVD